MPVAVLPKRALGMDESAGVEPYWMFPLVVKAHTSRYQLDRLAIFPTTTDGTLSPDEYTRLAFEVRVVRRHLWPRIMDESSARVA